jgi:hypothetical protein
VGDCLQARGVHFALSHRDPKCTFTTNKQILVRFSARTPTILIVNLLVVIESLEANSYIASNYGTNTLYSILFLIHD